MTDDAVEAVQESSDTTEAVPAEIEAQVDQSQGGETQRAAETSSVEPSGEDSAEKQQETPKRNGAQARISEINRKWRAEQQRANDAEQRLSMLQLQQGNSEPEAFPQLEDFDYDQGQYQQAVSEHMLREQKRSVQNGIAEQHRVEAQMATQAANAAAQDMFIERSRNFMEDHPDFGQVVSDPRFVQSDTVRQAIVFAENGPALAYHLASNPMLTSQINSLPAALAGMELGKIAARLATPPTPKTSNTPPPAAPVGPTGTPERNPDDMTPKQYQAWRQKQQKAEG